MFDANVAILLVVCLMALVAVGVHIAIALGMTSALGIFMVTGADSYAFHSVQTMLAATAYEAIRAYVFAVIPLFMLMGEFIGKSGTVTDVYRGINRLLHRLPGRLAIATVLGNALFSFVTGVSIASAAAFSRIAYPEMKRFGYHRGFALGTRRRVELPRHADPAERPDDRLGHPHRAVDRPDLRRRHPARVPADGDVRPPTSSPWRC